MFFILDPLVIIIGRIPGVCVVYMFQYDGMFIDYQWSIDCIYELVRVLSTYIQYNIPSTIYPVQYIQYDISSTEDPVFQFSTIISTISFSARRGFHSLSSLSGLAGPRSIYKMQPQHADSNPDPPSAKTQPVQPGNASTQPGKPDPSLTSLTLVSAAI